MALNQTLFAVDFASVLLIIISIIFLVKNRRFEHSSMESSVNATIFGIFFLLFMMIANMLQFAVKGYPETFGGITNFSTYVQYLLQISELVLIPLFAVCFLVSVYVARERLQQL